MLRILHVGLGPLGVKVVSDLYDRKLGTVVAAIDHDPGVVGKMLCEIVPNADGETRIVGHLDEVEELSDIRCAIVTTSSDLELCMDTFRTLLKAGVAVVSTCEELSWPWLRHPVAAQELHEMCVRYGGRIVGTGVNPGFLMDALPVAASIACREVRSVLIERIQDASTRRIPFQRKIGAGLDDTEFKRRVDAGTLRHVGLGESLHFVAHHLGFELERWDETIHALHADTELECGLGKISIGGVRGVEQSARGWIDGQERIKLVFRAAIAEPDPCDRITLDADPPITVEIPGGVHGDVATSAICMNVIRPLLSVAPGLHTMGSLPLQGCATPDDFAPPVREPSAAPDPPVVP